MRPLARARSRPAIVRSLSLTRSCFGNRGQNANHGVPEDACAIQITAL
jgi:hypothetical protein